MGLTLCHNSTNGCTDNTCFCILFNLSFNTYNKNSTVENSFHVSQEHWIQEQTFGPRISCLQYIKTNTTMIQQTNALRMQSIKYCCSSDSSQATKATLNRVNVIPQITPQYMWNVTPPSRSKACQHAELIPLVHLMFDDCVIRVWVRIL